MHTRNAYAVLVFGHYVAEIVGARNSRNVKLACADVFGIIGRNCDGVDERVTAVNVFCAMLVKDLRPLDLKRFGEVASLSVRDRRVFIARYWYTCSVSQIAKEYSLK